MNYSALFAFSVGAFGALFLSSCSLYDGSSVSVASPLRDGVRYELRHAMAANDSFEPWELRSVYFVLKPEAPPVVAGARTGNQGVLSVRTTAYCHSEADHLPFGRLSAAGSPLRFGAVRSAAADWSRFPLGTRFRIKNQPGVIYEVDDYGSALVGSNTIDLYYPTRSGMNNWGVRNCNIEVIQWGSFSASLDAMKSNVHCAHVRHMVRDIQVRLGGSNARTVAEAPSKPAGPPGNLVAMNSALY